jgi:hypothetical protein
LSRAATVRLMIGVLTISPSHSTSRSHSHHASSGSAPSAAPLGNLSSSSRTSSTCAPSASAARSAAFSKISALPCGWPQPSPSTVPLTGIIEALPGLASSFYGTYYLTVRTRGSRGRLAGKRALISGTGGGIGRATALLCARKGARRWVEAAADLAGGIDILVNNASAIRFGPIGELSFADWSFTIRNELDIVFLVTRAAWPHLVAAGANIPVDGGAAVVG